MWCLAALIALALVVTCAISMSMGYYHGKVAAYHEQVRKNQMDFDARERERDNLRCELANLMRAVSRHERYVGSIVRNETTAVRN